MASVCTNSHLTWLELDSFEPSDNSWRDINFFCNRSVKMDKALDSVSHTKGRIKPDGLTLCGIQEGMKSFSNPISSWCQCCLHPRVKWSRGEDVTIATKTGGICTGLRLQHFSLLSPLTGFQIGGGGEGFCSGMCLSTPATLWTFICTYSPVPTYVALHSHRGQNKTHIDRL